MTFDVVLVTILIICNIGVIAYIYYKEHNCTKQIKENKDSLNWGYKRRDD